MEKKKEGLLMSQPYEEPLFECWYCGDYFERHDVVEEDGHIYCNRDYEELKKKGEL